MSYNPLHQPPGARRPATAQNGRTQALESAVQGITVNAGETHRAYRFEDYRLDAGERILEHAGREVPMTPTLFEILLTLVENSGSILDKEHFMRTEISPGTFPRCAGSSGTIRTAPDISRPSRGGDIDF